MSSFLRFAPGALATLSNQTQQISQSITNIQNSLNQLNQNIQNSNDAQPKPFTFLSLNNQGVSANVAANTIIVPGIPVPAGYRGIVKDFNINFTTLGGQVGYAVLDYNGKNIIQIITSNINSSSSGLGNVVLDGNTCIGIIGTAQGVGVLSGYLSGEIKKIQ